MASMSAKLATGVYGTVPDESGLVKEPLVITGASSAIGTTLAYTTIMKQPQRAEAGPLSYSIAGQVVTFTDTSGIGNGLVGATIYGYQ